MTQRTIVLDANILIRAVLGERVRQLITEHAADVRFFAPDTAYAEAREHLPALLEKRGVNGAVAMAARCARNWGAPHRCRAISAAGAAGPGAHW